MNDRRREAVLVPVLLLTVLVMSVVSSVGAPLIPDIAKKFHEPLATAQWSLTITLLTGAVTATVIGRISDGPRRRPIMIGGLAAVTAGGAVSALAPNLGTLIVGRGLQGVGVGLVPVAMAAARDHLPHHKVGGTIALLSVANAAAVGAGYPISGLVADAFGVAGAFWFGTAFTVVALLAVLLAFPGSTTGSTARLDVAGAVLLSLGVVALLVAVAQGNDWGWSSPAVVGLLAAAVVLLAVWAWWQLRADAPLVDLRLLGRRAVLSGNSCGMVLGVTMYMYLSEVTEFEQVSQSNGFGFSASVVVAGLSLVPFSVCSLTASRCLPWVSRHVGQRGVLPVGSAIVAASGVFFALWHSSLWTGFATMGFLGIGTGLTFAAIPGLILGATPASETGSSMGFYQVVRYVGFSFGSALTAVILGAHTPVGGTLPSEAGYILVLWIGAALAAVAALVTWVLPAKPARGPGAQPGVRAGTAGSLPAAGRAGSLRDG